MQWYYQTIDVAVVELNMTMKHMQQQTRNVTACHPSLPITLKGDIPRDTAVHSAK